MVFPIVRNPDRSICHQHLHHLEKKDFSSNDFYIFKFQYPAGMDASQMHL